MIYFISAKRLEDFEVYIYGSIPTISYEYSELIGTIEREKKQYKYIIINIYANLANQRICS